MSEKLQDENAKMESEEVHVHHNTNNEICTIGPPLN